MNKFGWSLPPGCTKLPADEEYPYALRCPNCGAFLTEKPDRIEPWEDRIINDDPRFGKVGEEIILAAGIHEYRNCKKCGDEVRNPLPVFI